MTSLLEQDPAQFLEQYKKLPDLLDGDDITPGFIWSGWLTRGEWELVYALSLAMEGAGRAPLASTLNDLMVAAMSFLKERGWHFRGLRILDGDRVLRRRHAMVEPHNGLFILMLASGKVPDYVTHFGRALFLVENSWSDPEVKEMLRAAFADIEATLKTRPDQPPESLRPAIQARAAHLRELAQRLGIDLRQPGALDVLMRADSELQTLEEELEN